MDYETEKGKKGEEYYPDEMSTIRIILKSQVTKIRICFKYNC